MKLRSILMILIINLLVLISTSVYAHKPIFSNGTNTSIENAIKIENPEISWAVYGELTKNSRIQYYVIDGEKGMDLYVQMTIPKIKGNEDFTPSIAILGREFEQPEEDVSFDVPQGYGVKIIEPTQVKEEFFEPFTQTRYFFRQEETIELENKAPYYIVIYDQEEDEGKYTLAVGKKEEFGIKDIFLFPFTWLKVRFWYNGLQTVFIIVLIITFVALLVKTIKNFLSS